MQVVRFYACTIYLNKLTSALSSKEISLKNDHHCGGRGQFNGIYYTIFSKVLCSAQDLLESPPLMRKAICKYILRALKLTFYL